MKEVLPTWLRGSLPNWIIVVLTGMLVWTAKEMYTDFKNTIGRAVDSLHQQDKRITVLEDWRKERF